MKNWALKMLMASCLTIFFGVGSAAAFCTDTVPSQYLDAAKYLYSENVLKGYPDGSCKLNNPINRAESMTFILRWAVGEDELKSVTIPAGIRKLHDFADGQWWTNPAAKAYELGILKGDSNGNIRPGDKVIFVENLAMVMRAGFGFEAIPKASAGQQWYQPMVDAAKASSITTYDPGKQLTRGEVVKMIYDMDNRYHDVESYFENHSGGGSSTNTTTPEATATPAPQSNNSSGGGTKTFTAASVIQNLKYVVENFHSISASDAASRLSNLNQVENYWLGLYDGWSFTAALKACQGNSSFMLTVGQYRNTPCAKLQSDYALVLQFSTPEAQNQTAETSRNQLLTTLKCQAGEFDAQFCSSYFGVQQGINNMVNQMNQSIIGNIGGTSCNSPGSYLPDGSFCAPN